jgi:lipoprotein-releasing system permease protein
MRYEWFIAKRYLRPQGGATFIFHLTIISIAGVALGVAALITVLSVMNGFANDTRSKILLGQSHTVLKYWEGLENYEDYIPQFQQVENVKACSPIIENWGALFSTDYSGRGRYAVTFIGIDADLEPAVTGLEEKIIAGNLDGLREEKNKPSSSGKVKITEIQEPKQAGIIIGKQLAAEIFGVYKSKGVSEEEYNKRFERVIGQRITIITIPDQIESITLGIKKDKTFCIEGVFESGYYQHDYGRVYISLPSAQYLLELPNQITQIQFHLLNHGELATGKTAEKLYELNSTLVGKGFPETWMQFNQVFFQALMVEKLTMNYILRIIILVATFNIIATLFMVVTEKTRDIGLLRAIGASRRNIMRIFILLGLIVGILGAGLGVLGGFTLCTIIQWTELKIPGGGEIYYLEYLPCEMEIADFVGVCIYTIVVSFLASLYPAIRASKLLPVEALRFT